MSDLHTAIEKAIADHCEGGDLWVCAHIASEPFDALLAKQAAEMAERDAVIAACAQAVGASVTSDCSADFRAMLPGEIKAAIAERDALIADYRKEFTATALALTTERQRAERAEAELARLESEMPSASGRDVNAARDALGEVRRMRIGPNGDYPEIGVVEVQRATDALVQAYAEANGLRNELARLRAQEPPFLLATGFADAAHSAGIRFKNIENHGEQT